MPTPEMWECSHDSTMTNVYQPFSELALEKLLSTLATLEPKA
jgi:hypothetical protein